MPSVRAPTRHECARRRRRARQVDRPVKSRVEWRNALRTLHGPVPPDRAEPDARARTRPRSDRAPRSARLPRGLDRRAPLRRLRDHLVARGLHRRGRGPHQVHPARQRRELAPLPPAVDARRSVRAARPPDARPGHARLRPGATHLRRAHARHPGRHATTAHGRSARRDHGVVPRRDGHEVRPTGSRCRTRVCS